MKKGSVPFIPSCPLYPLFIPFQVNAFCQEFLNPYVNFHRPGFFAETITDEKGKTRKRYRLTEVIPNY